jgi:hypothetical protein
MGYLVLGLDMRFLGGKCQKKNDGDGKGNRMSCFALRALLLPFDYAQGRVEAASRLASSLG